MAGYVQKIEDLRGKGVKLIVIPEKIARTTPQWAQAAQAKLAAAANDAGATLVVGMDMRDGDKSYNVSWAFTHQSPNATVYTKRHFVPKHGGGMEYTQAHSPLASSPTARVWKSARTWISKT